MAANNEKRKVGRPLSGKKGYCIRMSPTTCAKLRLAAKRDGCAHLDEWLTRIAAASEAIDPASLKGTPFEDLSGAFRHYCGQAANALSALFQVADENMLVPDEPDNQEAFKKVKTEYTKLVHFLMNFGSGV